MADTPKDLKDYIETRARGGEAAFAVAFALLELSEAQKQTANALERLGFNGDGKGPGPTEKMAIEMERIANALAGKSN